MRPHVEVIQDTDYIWHKADLPASTGEAREQRLSYDEEDGSYIEESIPGYSVERILGMIQYNAEDLCRMLKRQVDKATKADSVRPREGVAMVDLYERLIRGRTYLIPHREEAKSKKASKKK